MWPPFINGGCPGETGVPEVKDVAREGQLLPLVLVELIYRLNDLPFIVFGGAF